MLLHCPCLCCHSFCDSMWSFCVEANLFRSSCRLFIYVLLLEIKLSRCEHWFPINRFKTATFLCLHQARIWIFDVICHDLSLCLVSSVKMRGEYSFCWYSWNWWLPPFKPFFIILSSKISEIYLKTTKTASITHSGKYSTITTTCKLNLWLYFNFVFHFLVLLFDCLIVFLYESIIWTHVLSCSLAYIKKTNDLSSINILKKQ